MEVTDEGIRQSLYTTRQYLVEEKNIDKGADRWIAMFFFFRKKSRVIRSIVLDTNLVSRFSVKSSEHLFKLLYEVCQN